MDFPSPRPLRRTQPFPLNHALPIWRSDPSGLTPTAMSFTWTAENIQAAIGLWNSGLTGREIAEAIQAPSRGAVTRKITRLRAKGISVERRPSPIRSGPPSVEAGMFAWTAENIQTAVELWNKGRTGGEIAKAIRAPSPGAVTRQISRLRAQGAPVEIRGSPITSVQRRLEAGMFAWTAENIQTAVALWTEGRTSAEIAEAIHATSPGAVTRQISRLRAQGVPVEERSSPIRSKPVSSEPGSPELRPAGSERHEDDPVLLVRAGFRQCRYPLWDKQSDPKLVCGKRTVDANSSWCGEHYALIWRAGEKRARSEPSQKATGEHRDRQQTSEPQP